MKPYGCRLLLLASVFLYFTSGSDSTELSSPTISNSPSLAINSHDGNVKGIGESDESSGLRQKRFLFRFGHGHGHGFGGHHHHGYHHHHHGYGHGHGHHHGHHGHHGYHHHHHHH